MKKRRIYCIRIIYLCLIALFLYSCSLNGKISANNVVTLSKSKSNANLSTKKAQELCKKIHTSDLNGAFRELDCLITIYRATFREKSDIQFTRLVRKKFSSLYKRLQKESVDWRTVFRWQMLYILGTRLYPIQNKLAEKAKLPIYEVNGHHLAVPFWLKEHLKGRELGTLFHLDTHNDMRAVPSPRQVLRAVSMLKNRKNVKTAWHIIAHSIYDCAMPVAAGILTVGFSRVVWGKPSWNGYPEILNRTFFFAQPKPKTPVASLSQYLSPEQRFKLRKKILELNKNRNYFRLYYDRQMNKNFSHHPTAEAWLEIGPSQRPVSEKFDLIRPFTFSIITANYKLNSKEGEERFKKLLKAMPPGPFTLDLDLDFFASIDSTPGFRRKAGSSPEWQQELFKKRRKTLKVHLKRFKELLLQLKKYGRVPTLITIADSTYLTFALDPIAEGQSEYSPIEHTAFLRREVRKIFSEVYKEFFYIKEKTNSVANKK